MRILLITYHFPPFNQIGAVRLGKMAKYLRALGHEVRVLTANDYLRRTDLDLEIPADEVIYTPWLDINKPGRLFYRQKGPVVEHADSPPPNPLVEKLRLLYEACVNFPDDRAGWLPYLFAAGSRLIGTWRPDVIYASGAPFSALVAASLLAKRFKLPWVAELRDPWSENHHYRLPRWRKHLDTFLEHRVLASAQGLVTVTEPWAARLQDRYGKPTACIPNGFDPSDFPIPIQPEKGKVLRLVYAGAFYPGGQNPEPLFAALKLLGPQRESITIHFHGTTPHVLRQMAIRHGVEAQLHFTPAIPYRDSLARQMQADVLLLLLWQQPPGVYPGKIFEYLGARRPVLAVGPANDISAQLIRERKAGEVANRPEEIAGLLSDWLSRKEAGGIPFLPESVSCGVSRKERAETLVAFLNDLFPDRGSSR